MYDINVHYLSKAVRWGAILKEENIDKISNILGEDMLNMEEKERFLETIEEVNNDTSILNDWVLVKLAEEKEKDQLNYASEEGMEEKNKEVVINMLTMGMDYSVISQVTNKSVDEIKEIEDSIK